MLAETGLVEGALKHLWSNWDDVLTGSIAFGLVAHLVNTFPTPKNVYLQWAIGGLQYLVGQRKSAYNTLQGNNTATVPISREDKVSFVTGSGTGTGTTGPVEVHTEPIKKNGAA